MSLQNLILNVLRNTPKPILRKIAGPPFRINGAQLDVNVQILANLAAKAGPVERTTPADYRQMASAFDALALPDLPGVVTQDFEFQGPAGSLKVRSHTPAGVGDQSPAVLFFHQGGLVIMDHLTDNHFCSLLAQRCGARVFSLDYRLCPENDFPAPIEDGLGLWEYVQQNAEGLGVDPSRVALAGDSAGGMISAAMSHELRDRAGIQPVALCLAYPWVSPNTEGQESAQSFGDVFPMTTDTMAFFNAMVFPEDKNIDHPWANPLHQANLANLPPTVLATAGLDPIRDQGNAYAKALQSAGGTLIHHCYETLPHSFLVLGRVTRTAQQACVEIADDLARLL